MTTREQNESRLDTIDIFRFLAAFIVVGVHAIVIGYNPPTITTLFDEPQYYLGHFNYFAPLIRGHMGVQLFFIISGYCMALVAYSDRKAPSMRSSFRAIYNYYKYFLAKRIYRIYPLFAIHILILIFFVNQPQEYLARTLLFLGNISPESITAISSVTWSLAVEVQFYLIFPALFLIVKNRPTVLLFIYSMAIVYQLFSSSLYGFIQHPDVSFILGNSVFGYLHYFLFGLLLYEYRKSLSRFTSKYSLAVPITFIFLISCFYDTGRDIGSEIVANLRIVFAYSASLLMCLLLENQGPPSKTKSFFGLSWQGKLLNLPHAHFCHSPCYQTWHLFRK